MDGIIIINKTKGYTSHDIVHKVKKILNEKVGHTGTLDPNATGVLPLLIGKGTEISKYLINHDKTYKACLKLGTKTDTADVEGQVIEEKEVNNELLTKPNVEKVLKSFIGKQEQLPPMYSAIKVNGKKLYEYARKGEKIEIEPRQIEIYEMDLLKIDDNEIHFVVKCSKGTYIRSLCEDIANKLETVGFMKNLKRIQVGEFNIDDSITVEELKKLCDTANNVYKIFENENSSMELTLNLEKTLGNSYISIEKQFEDKKTIILNEDKLKLFLNGVNLTYNLDDDIYKIYTEQKEFVGLGIVKNNLLKRDVILRNF